MVSREVVEKQTGLIIRFLFDNEDNVAAFRQTDSYIEADGADHNDDKFDPVLIADKLRSVADGLMIDDKFKAALDKLQQAVAEEAMEAAFSQSVEALCQAPVSQRGEVVSEMQLIQASVALGLYVKKHLPQLKSNVQVAMVRFLNSRVGDWLVQQGGWDIVANA